MLKRDITITINLISITLWVASVALLCVYIFREGRDTSLIMSTIYFVGWILYNKDKVVNIKSWSFNIGKDEEKEDV